MRGLLALVIFLISVGALVFFMSHYQTADTCFSLENEEEMMECLNGMSDNLQNYSSVNESLNKTYTCDILDDDCVINESEIFDFS